MLISVDLDDVLVYTQEQLKMWARRKYGVNSHQEKLTDHYSTTTNIPAIQITHEFLASDLQLETPMVELGRPILRALHADGYDFLVTTYRDIKFQKQTERLIHRHYGEDFFKKIILCSNGLGRYVPKAEICEREGVSLHIDDKLSYCEGLREANISFVTFGDLSWTKHAPGIPHAKDMLALYRLLHKT